MEMMIIRKPENDDENSRRRLQKTQFSSSNQEDGIGQTAFHDSNADGAFVKSHREMAIDCPPSFIGGRKEPPRFPRPLSLIHNTIGHSQTSLSTPKMLNEQPKVTHEAANSGENLLSFQNADKIRRYQEDIQKKRELEERLKKENEFLRTSLRGSKKLQDLEDIKRKDARQTSDVLGIVNSNFLADDENKDFEMKTITRSHLQSAYNETDGNINCICFL